jgi:hypothetical protein
MATELVLMECGFDRMNVPGEKVQEYLAAGWKEFSRKPQKEEPEEKPATPAPVAPALAILKGKGKGK